MDITVEIHNTDDGWNALYINGVCVRQDHANDLLENWFIRRFLDKDAEPVNVLSVISEHHGGTEVEESVLNCGAFPDTLEALREL